MGRGKGYVRYGRGIPFLAKMCSEFIKVYLLLTIEVLRYTVFWQECVLNDGARSSTQNRRKKTPFFFLHGSRCMYLGHGIFHPVVHSSFVFLRISFFWGREALSSLIE